jgi:hypothetical protein
MLNVLYILTGDAVRTGYGVYPRERLARLLVRAEETGDGVVQRWVERSRALMAAPDTFDYDLWCGGGYAYGPHPDRS